MKTRTTTRVATERLQAPAPFDKPGPGSWTLDASHCERPLPRFVEGVFEESFARGMREGFAAFGALLDTIEAAVVNGFLYTSVRPVGAPPDATGTPPKAVFKLLTWLHPSIRARIQRAETAMTTRLWREETRLYLETWSPPLERRADALRHVDRGALDGAAFAAHVRDIHRLLVDETFLHHRVGATRIVPVGDFLAHVQAWTGAGATEILTALRGHSRHSEQGLAELRRLADLVREDETVRAAVTGPGDAEATLASLERRGDGIGAATRAWIDAAGHLVTGFSPGYPTLRESPAALLNALRGALTTDGERAREEAKTQAAEDAVASLRARVPEASRPVFDALLEEARATYFVRDHTCMRSLGAFGIARLAVLDAGRRLVATGVLEGADDALDLTVDELARALETREAPPRAEIAARGAWRRSATASAAPELLGPRPGDPPPADWLPGNAARLHRAVGAYLSAMFGEREAKRDDDAATKTVVVGLPASGGKRIGTARLVLEPGDFDRVQPGDVLVARITTPSYNALLPMLAGIVTDRGGVLSHPAIVSREYGIPGVVGTKLATARIPDGARVEIDGDAGTVRVLG